MNSFTAPDGEVDTQILVASLRAYLHEQLSQYDGVEENTEYINNSLSLPDTYAGLFYILTTHSLSTHKWLWLLGVSELCKTTHGVLLSEQNIKHSQLRGVDSSFLNARAAYTQSFSQLSRLISQLFSQIDIVWLRSQPDANKIFLQLLSTSTDICLVDPVSLYVADTLVQSAAKVMQRYSQASPDTDTMHDSATMVEPELFSIVVKFARLAYLSGNCSSTLHLIFPQHHAPLVSEKLVPHLMENTNILLNDIIDFYRYYAYSLITMVAEQDEIHDSWLNKADLFLSVLLHVPSLHVDNYSSGTIRLPSSLKYVSHSERGELSFFYILCYLLRLRSIAGLVDPEPSFSTERSYFLSSFNKRVATELDISASSSSSRAGSVVSMSKYSESASLTNSHCTNRNISSILSQGTYKEKVRLVMDFFQLVGEGATSGSIRQLIQSFDFASLRQSDTFRMNPGDSEILHVLSRIDKHVYPGKALYVNAIDNITRLIQLLALKEFHLIFGTSVQPASVLSFLGSHYTVDEVLRTKEILAIDGDSSLRIPGTLAIPEESLLKNQLETLDLTQELEKATQSFC